MTIFITGLSHIVQIVHIVQKVFLTLAFPQVLNQGWVKFIYLFNSLSFSTGIVLLQSLLRNTDLITAKHSFSE